MVGVSNFVSKNLIVCLFVLGFHTLGVNSPVYAEFQVAMGPSLVIQGPGPEAYESPEQMICFINPASGYVL